MSFLKSVKKTAPSFSTSQQLNPPAQNFNKLLTSLKNGPSKPAILSIVSGFSESYIPSSLKPDLPPLLTELYDKELSESNFKEILSATLPKATDSFYKITDCQQKAAERETRAQPKSRLWFRFRAGRGTASKYKAACQTDPARPSHSLIMGICYPETVRFSTEATEWGCTNEQSARACYAAKATKDHEIFLLSDCGLFISKTHAYLGATPDGLVSCNCCGAGICEVKVRMENDCQGNILNMIKYKINTQHYYHTLLKNK